LTKIIEYIKNPWKIFVTLAARGFFDNMSDAQYLKCMYRARFNKRLDLENPISFNEKLQWLKIYDRNPVYTKLVDKYEVKKIVKDIIGEDYVIATLGVWNSFDEINFENLPNSFVLKCTHDSGGMVVERDKNNLDIGKTKAKIEKSLKRNYFYREREWPYKDVEPRVIAEKFMQDEMQKSGLIDYKFYCFNGVPRCLYVSEGLENHSTAKISFLNIDWSFAEFKRKDFESLEELPKKPQRYEEMIEIARKLSQTFPFVRVDLYEIDGQVYFSELTFTPAAGMMPFEPQEWDRKLGEFLQLPKVIHQE